MPITSDCNWHNNTVVLGKAVADSFFPVEKRFGGDGGNRTLVLNILQRFLHVYPILNWQSFQDGLGSNIYNNLYQFNH